jgi:hypothetical protein
MDTAAGGNKELGWRHNPISKRKAADVDATMTGKDGTRIAE